MSEGARYADVVLPGSAWSEDEGVTCNSEGRVVKINKANNPPGEARADWWIILELARRMGREKYFDFNSPREIFDELRVASRGGNADYYGITWEKIVSIMRMGKRSFIPSPTTRRRKCRMKSSLGY
jgi:assimilatory nitrate reductase catalytic subunit